MTSKRALVVDDSKSARVVLSRMLEKFGIGVDTADSAEAALEYLQAARPDVIFMDHLMPGMDGLQAVRAIKANPATAAIPIMMYTSQEGDLYAGLARASGAVGVLPKSIHPIDVTKALYQLQLLPDRRDRAPPVLQPVDHEGRAAEPAGAAVAPAPDAALRGAIEQLLREQSIELRRFIVATVDSHAHRIVTELRPREPEAAPVEEPPVAASPPARAGGWAAAATAALAALTVGALLYWQAREADEQASRALAAATTASNALAASFERLRQQLEQAPAASAPPAAALQRTVVLPVPFGEPPLAAARLDALRNIIGQLERDGIGGRVRVETFAGSFCLEALPEQGLALADPATPAAQCGRFGNPQDDLPNGAPRQPLGFANLAATVRRRSAGALVLELASGARDRLAATYPALDAATAGQWNAVAQANNRIEITIVEGP